MNVYFILITESLLSILVSIFVLYMLSKPLKNVLYNVCPDDQSAIFWLTYTKVILVIVPLLLVLIMDLLTQNSHPIDSYRFTLIAVLGGLLIALYSIGKQLAKFVISPQGIKEKL